MRPRPRLAQLLPLAALLAVGSAWGLGAPLVRMARIDGHSALSIVAWHSVLGALVLAAVLLVRGRARLPMGRDDLMLYAAVATLGIVVPHLAAFVALGHVPAAVHSIVVSLVPIFALAFSLVLRIERLRLLRLAGVGLGALAIALMILPDASLPDDAIGAFVLLSLIAPLCYALEGIFVAHRSRSRAGPMQALLGGSVLAALVVVPVAALRGGIASPLAPWGQAELAVAIAGISGALAYAGYVALLRRAGAVFGAQVAYVVTVSGVFWAIALLGETPTAWVWSAMLLLFAGLFMVQPAPRSVTRVLRPADPSRPETPLPVRNDMR